MVGHFNSSMQFYYSMNFYLVLLFIVSQIIVVHVCLDTFDFNTSDRTENCKPILTLK